MTTAFSPINAAYMKHASGNEVAFHAHQQGQLTIAIKGSVRIQAVNGWWLAIPGAGIWVPAGISHRAHYTESAELLNLRFDAHEQGVPENVALLMVSPLLMALAHQAYKLGQSQADLPQLGVVRQLVVYQLRDNQASSGLFIADGQDKRLRVVTALLKDNPGCNKTLAELADTAHSSPRTLARLFEKETQLNFTAWRERLRILTAIERLLIGVPATAVAFDMGFQSASSFSTAFRKIMGVPPGQYLRQVQRNNKAQG